MAEEYESGESILEEQAAEPSVEATPEAPAQPDTAPVAEAQPDWNGEEWTLKFRDQPYVPKSRDELIALAQRGKLYDSKQSEYTEKATALEKRAEEVKQYEDLAKAFQGNPRFQQDIMDRYYAAQAGGIPQQQAPEQQAAAQIPPELAEKVTNMETQLTQFQQAQADDMLNKEVDTLKGKYQQFDWETIDSNGDKLSDQIMKVAHDMGGVSLETAFRHSMWDQMQEHAKAQALKAQAEARAAQGGKGKPVPTPQSQAPAPQPRNISAASYDDLAAEAIAELGA